MARTVLMAARLMMNVWESKKVDASPWKSKSGFSLSKVNEISIYYSFSEEKPINFYE